MTSQRIGNLFDQVNDSRFGLTDSSGRLGKAGGEVFYIPSEDLVGFVSQSDILRATGSAQGVRRAYLSGQPIYGLEFPVVGTTGRIPNAIRYSSNPNFLPGDRTALALGENGTGGLLLNKTREFVTDPFGIPKGSILFRIERDGRKVIVRRFE